MNAGTARLLLSVGAAASFSACWVQQPAVHAGISALDAGQPAAALRAFDQAPQRSYRVESAPPLEALVPQPDLDVLVVVVNSSARLRENAQFPWYGVRPVVMANSFTGPDVFAHELGHSPVRAP